MSILAKKKKINSQINESVKNSMLIFINNKMREIPIVSRTFLTKDFFLSESETAIFAEENDEKLIISFNGMIKEIDEFSSTKINNFTFIWFRHYEKTFLLAKFTDVGKENYCKIKVKNAKNSFFIENNQVFIENTDEIYINGVRAKSEIIQFDDGDILFADNIYYQKNGGVIKLSGDIKKISTCLCEISPNSHVNNKNVNLEKTLISNDIEKICFPPVSLIKKSHKIAQKTALIFAFVILFIIAICLKISYEFIAGFCFSVAVFSFIKSFFAVNSANSELEKDYREKLIKLRKQLFMQKTNIINSMNYNFPSAEEIMKITENSEKRPFNATEEDDDFLLIDVGKSQFESGLIKLNFDERKNFSKKFADEINELYEKWKFINDMPTIIDLKKTKLGFVGERKNFDEQIQLIISQIAFKSSNHNVQFIYIHDDDELDKFEFSKWLPHFNISKLNINGCQNKLNSDELLRNLAYILDDRLLKIKQENELFTPHFVFIIAVKNFTHYINKYFDESEILLGFSVIYFAKTTEDLPKNVSTIIDICDSNNANIILKNNKFSNKEIKLNRLGSFNLEIFSRRLTSLTHAYLQKNDCVDITAKTSDEITKCLWNEAIGENIIKPKAEKPDLKTEPENLIIIGFDNEKNPVGIDLDEPINLIVGPKESGKTNILHLIANECKNKAKIYIFDSPEMPLSVLRLSSENINYAVGEVKILEDFYEIANIAKTQINDNKIIILIDNADYFINQISKNPLSKTIINDALVAGIRFIIAAENHKLRGYDSITRIFRNAKSGIILGKLREQNILKCDANSNYIQNKEMAHIYKNGNVKFIKIPLAD